MSVPGKYWWEIEIHQVNAIQILFQLCNLENNIEMEDNEINDLYCLCSWQSQEEYYLRHTVHNINVLLGIIVPIAGFGFYKICDLVT